MDANRTFQRAPWPRAGYATAAAKASTPAAPPPPPPPPRPYNPLPAKERISRHPEHPAPPTEVTVEKKRGWFKRLWPSAPKTPMYPPTQDPTRGLEAARRVVKEGFLDPRYKRAARSFTAIMCALPIAIYTSYELFQRRFKGKEQKVRPVVPPVAANEDGN